MTLQPLSIDDETFDAATNSRAWPFEEARKVIKRLENLEKAGKAKVGPVIFETGYGPSGLPHIGTFGEVARTSMVRTAFRLLTKDRIETNLICFSDDMDGFRKVPANVPNQEMMASHLGKPLSRVPDPFSNEYSSFGAANNARLQAFLDQFGFDYEFISATDYYTSGRLDSALLRMLEVYDEVMDIILPTLGPDRQKTYSPFLPLCPRTGIVLQVPMISRDVAKGTITYLDPETGEEMETAVTGGAVKCQWKADWAMRWFALGVDYEMAGKDLIDSVRLSSRIVKAMGAKPPENLSYELFLDENGAKISKSKGNGLSIEDWLTYASPQSLSLFMYQKPKTAKRLHFDIIPKTVDEYFIWIGKYDEQDSAARIDNPAWHIHSGTPPKNDMPISFGLLLNLVSAANAPDADTLWGFISRYAPDASKQNNPQLNQMVGYAIQYFDDFVRPTKTFRLANDKERKALEALDKQLAANEGSTDASALQNIVYAIGNEFEFAPLRGWFQAIYQILLGQDQGPRFGSFIALYGVTETRALIAKALAGELAGELAK